MRFVIFTNILIYSHTYYMNNDKKRCEWAKDSLSIIYHDIEWGVPVHDDRTLFEFLILEGAQAGLSWTTILKKRDNYRKAFDLFNVKKIAQYDSSKMSSLLTNEGIIRNKLKIAATIQNAKSFIDVQKECGSFDKYIWQFVENKPKKILLKILVNILQKRKKQKQ